MRRRSVKASLPILVLAAGLAGCATLEPDAALAPVKAAATAHLGGKSVTLPSGTDDDATVDARVAELLRAPLDSDAALQVALLNHRGLRASLHDIGMADALRVQDSTLPNPGFSFGRFKSGDEREIDRSLHFSLARVIALPWLRDAAQQRLKATQSAVALKVVQHGMDTRRAWVRAVAARENLRYAQQVMRAAEAGADLARRMQQVGNFSPLQRAREQAFHADAALGVARAELAERVAREQLTRLMGLWGPQADAYALPERLPDLPPLPRERADAERIAVTQRLDLQAALQQAAQAGAVRSASRLSPWTDGLEAGLERNGEQGGPGSRGWEIGFELPLFDRGAARQSMASHAADMARHHRDEIVPLRQVHRRGEPASLQRHADRRVRAAGRRAAQIASVHGAIDALRDFWLADADLDMALDRQAQLLDARPAIHAPCRPRPRRRPGTEPEDPMTVSRRRFPGRQRRSPLSATAGQQGGDGGAARAVIQTSPTPWRRWCPQRAALQPGGHAQRLDAAPGA
jgi:outer membrane protein TolC